MDSASILFKNKRDLLILLRKPEATEHPKVVRF